jgi:hypothetical protein
MKNFLLLTIIMSSLLAADLASAYAKYGGTHSCGSLLSEMRDNSRKHAGDKGYIAGFLTGVAFADKNYNPKRTDFEGVMKWVENYCSNNPLASLLDGLEILKNELDQSDR